MLILSRPLPIRPTNKLAKECTCYPTHLQSDTLATKIVAIAPELLMRSPSLMEPIVHLGCAFFNPMCAGRQAPSGRQGFPGCRAAPHIPRSSRMSPTCLQLRPQLPNTCSFSLRSAGCAHVEPSCHLQSLPIFLHGRQRELPCCVLQPDFQNFG